MKHWLLVMLLLSCSIRSIGQEQELPENVKADLFRDQDKMFYSFCNNDVAWLRQAVTPDYITINADGVKATWQQMEPNLAKFKGSTFKLSEQETRFYGNTAITTGRAKFYFSSMLAADVYFTQIWRYIDGKWRYAGWQGTMTGSPQNYPVYFTLLIIALIGIVLFFILRKRRKTS